MNKAPTQRVRSKQRLDKVPKQHKLQKRQKERLKQKPRESVKQTPKVAPQNHNNHDLQVIDTFGNMITVQ